MKVKEIVAFVTAVFGGACWSNEVCNLTPDVYSFSVTPAIQTKVNEQICIAFTLNCPTNTYYQRFLGYTIDWGDGKGAIPYEYAKTLTD